MTNTLIYGAAIAVQLLAAALIIVMVSDPQPTGLGQWADIAHHAPGLGHRPNVDVALAGLALPPARDIVWRAAAITAGSVIDGQVVAVHDEPQQEEESEQGPTTFDPTEPETEIEPDLCGATA